MKTMIVTGVAVLIIAGCAGPDTSWTKPGVTSTSYGQDTRECDREANRVARSAGEPGHQQWATGGTRFPASGGLESLRRVEHEEKFGACMQRKGYEKAS